MPEALTPSAARLVKAMKELDEQAKKLAVIQPAPESATAAARGRRLDMKIKKLLMDIRKLPRYR